MQVGMMLYQLWHRRLIVGLSLLIAVVAALSSAYKLSLSPPGLVPRSIGMATASTQVLVDNPYSIVLDLNQGGYQLQQMAQSATLLGNVMVSPAVRQDIARRVGIPVALIQTSAPATPQSPQAIVSPQPRKTTDLLASNNQYRINVQANPTVPILEIYTEAHSPVIAKALANAAVIGLSDYLSKFSPGVPAKQQLRIEQLGSAQGGAVTGGLRVEVLGLVFLFAFAISSAAILGIARVARAWKMSGKAAKMGSALNSGHGRTDPT
jgi:hypothetical protein